MNIVGLTVGTHDTSATLIAGGRIIGMAEEERFSRIKHDKSFPSGAIAYLLSVAGIRSTELDAVTVPYVPLIAWRSQLSYARVGFPENVSFVGKRFLRDFALLSKQEKSIRNSFAAAGLPISSKCSVIPVEHHLCHAASAYFTSPYDSAAIITWDGRGEWAWQMTAFGRGNSIRVAERQFVPHSLGQLYEYFTMRLGFSEFGDEYKVMGMAAYGKPSFLPAFRELVTIADGKVRINQKKFRHRAGRPRRSGGIDLVSTEYPEPRDESEPIAQEHFDLAASLQARMNEVGVAVARHLRGLSNEANLCIAGGIGQNIVLNQHIASESGFESVFVQPACHDGGLSLGGALEIASRSGAMRERFVMRHSLWGSETSRSAIAAELEVYGLLRFEPENLFQTVAALIAQGNVVGWFQGRAEFGPRALGARSILADPREKVMQDKVNRKIKFREMFRPFAPAVAAEAFGRYFTGAPSNPFMTFSASVRPEARDVLGAVTHVDGSARPQAVDRESSPKFWSLISEFDRITGVPVLLNTSFNVKGEPIVNSPADAIRCFFTTGLDYLVLESFLIAKRPEDLQQLINPAALFSRTQE